MKFVAILSLGLTVASAAFTTCPAYVCDPKDFGWTDGTCGATNSTDETHYYIRSVSCPSDHACPITPPTNSTCVPNPTPNTYTRYPGEPCGDGYKCTSPNNVCTSDKICATLKPGDTCEYSYDCNVNMTCINQVCSNLVAVGAKCTQSSDCVFSAGCPTPAEGDAICVEYLSIVPGKKVPDTCPETNVNAYCTTGRCLITPDGGICAQAVKSTESVPIACTVGGPACNSTQDTNAEKVLEGSCNCALDGNHYCSLYPGDSEVSDYLSYVKDFLNSTEIKKCSTSRKGADIPSYYTDCWRQAWANDKKLYSYYKGTAYETFANVDKCVLKLVSNDIYTAEESAALLILAGFALLN